MKYYHVVLKSGRIYQNIEADHVPLDKEWLEFWKTSDYGSELQAAFAKGTWDHMFSTNEKQAGIAQR